jgi:uncharacterized protein (DUF362 family)
MNANERPNSATPAGFDRRALLAGGGAALAAMVGFSAWRSATRPEASVFIARGQRYDGDLETTIRDGLAATGLDPAVMAGKRVLLKPNLVEPSRASPHMTTNPRVVVACAEVFRRWGAQVKVGEGPGHMRDTEWALGESGLGEALEDAGLEFVDLNYENVLWTPNRGGWCPLGGFYLPRSVHEADLVVSMPKLKTHHWVGMTASMKNLYGVLPGIKYGWPKNVLHHAGIPETVADIHASLPKTIAVVDGIECMEGDGPIMGTKKDLGILAMGTTLAALDATCARIMGLIPTRISYLRLIGDRLGPLDESRITERGEAWRSVASPFVILDEPHLRNLRATTADIRAS